jgi:hypothetical protein
MALEPIPTAEYLLPLNTLFLSPGKTIIYRIVSHPLCRLYWQSFDDPGLSKQTRDRLQWDNDSIPAVSPTPWTTENAWYDTGDPIKGWRRDGANYPSYLVQIYDQDIDTFSKPIFLTLRWVPITDNIENLLTITRAAQYVCQTTPVRPHTELNLSPWQISRMSQIA